MIYFKYLAMNLRAILEYRLSSWLIIFGQVQNTVFTFLGISLLFRRFGNIAGWTFAEVGLCFGVSGIAFSFAESFARGFDAFSGMVIKGEFDRVLLRPRNTIVQVLGARTDIARFGKIIVNAVILTLVIPRAEIIWIPSKICTLVFMVIGGTFVFTGIFILGAVVCFFTLDGLEVINIFTDGGRELASYPLPVYGSKGLTRFFTFVIPLGCVNYLPLMYLTGRAVEYPWLYMLAPLAGIFFLVPCLMFWQTGIKHYTSSGS